MSGVDAACPDRKSVKARIGGFPEISYLGAFHLCSGYA